MAAAGGLAGSSQHSTGQTAVASPPHCSALTSPTLSRHSHPCCTDPGGTAPESWARLEVTSRHKHLLPQDHQAQPCPLPKWPHWPHCGTHALGWPTPRLSSEQPQDMRGAEPPPLQGPGRAQGRVTGDTASPIPHANPVVCDSPWHLPQRNAPLVSSRAHVVCTRRGWWPGPASCSPGTDTALTHTPRLVHASTSSKGRPLRVPWGKGWKQEQESRKWCLRGCLTPHQQATWASRSRVQALLDPTPRKTFSSSDAKPLVGGQQLRDPSLDTTAQLKQDDRS